MPSHVPAKAPVATNPYHAQLDMVFEKIDAILANPKETMKPEKVPIWFADAVAEIHADGWLDTVAPFKVMDTIPGGQEPGVSLGHELVLRVNGEEHRVKYRSFQVSCQGLDDPGALETIAYSVALSLLKFRRSWELVRPVNHPFITGNWYMRRTTETGLVLVFSAVPGNDVEVL